MILREYWGLGLGRKLLDTYEPYAIKSGIKKVEAEVRVTPLGDLPTLETNRLILRQLAESDAANIHAYAKNPNVSKYTLWEPHRSIDDSLDYITNYAFGYYKEGKGLVPEACGEVMEYCFDHFGLKRIQAQCKLENTASARVMQKIGMTYEGTLKASIFHRNRSWDMCYYAVIRD